MTSPAATRPAAVSALQAGALADRVAPPTERVRDGVWSLSQPFAREPDYTLAYLVEDARGRLTIVDPGWATDPNAQALGDAIRSVGRDPADLDWVVVTHLHPDHIGLAERLRERTGARVAMHPAEQHTLVHGLGSPDDAVFARWGVPRERFAEIERTWGLGRRYPRVDADLLLEEGDVLPLSGRSIRVIWTPGHTTGSICLVDDDERLILTGDHVLPDRYPGVGLGGTDGGNAVAQYLGSLERMAEFTGYEVCPGHGYRFAGLPERADVLAAHQRKRTANVASALDELDRPTLWQLARALPWRGGLDAMTDYRLGSALTQTELHVDLLGRTAELAAGGELSRR